MKTQAVLQPGRLSPILQEGEHWGHTAVHPVAQDMTPAAEKLTRLNTDQNFSNVPVYRNGNSQTETACPFSPRTCPVHVQAKLKISQPDDEYEREADRVADEVMRMPEPRYKEQEEYQTRGCVPVIQRRATGRETPEEIPPIVEEVLRSPGRPLDAATRAFMEPRFGCDFSQVRVHTDVQAAESAQAVNALAYTVGQDVTFSAGQYAPGTSVGHRLLGHELTHTIQQGSAIRGIQKLDIANPIGAAEQEATEASQTTAEGRRLTARSGGVLRIARQEAPETAPKSGEEAALAAAVVTTASADVFDKADASATKQDLLKQFTSVDEIVEKRKVNGTWWYKIRYRVGKAEKFGWSLAENFSELASPKTFKFETPGSSGFGSPYEKLRKAVAESKLEPQIARLINYMNILVLPTPKLTLSDFVSKSFYDALVEAKGNFKQASLLMTAAVRSFKSTSSAGKFPWVQAKITTSGKFDPATFRDKIWHFFWNAYERFDGTGAAWLDAKGLAYELKSRPEPIKKFFKAEPLERDALEDIAFNRGGSMYAGWVMDNSKKVIKYHFSRVEKKFRDAIAEDPDASKLPDHEKDKLINRILRAKEAEVEIKKRCYEDFAYYAGEAVKSVLDAIGKIPSK